MSKTILVTGGSRGIGRATVRLAALRGYRVVFTYRERAEEAAKLTEEIRRAGQDCLSVQTDVSLADDVERLYREAIDAFGRVDVIVNNAGISSFSLFTDLSEEEWDHTFAVNTKGAFLVSKAFLPPMIDRKYGRIINVSSMWGISGSSCEVHYSASKAALIGMTKALAKELGPSGITVNCVAPGVIDTDMNAMLDEETRKELAEETPLCRLGTPEEVAQTILFLASDEASFITGQTISTDGGFVL